ncbi:MAG: LLM class flavin-dependent oxidoreductase, partial [Nitrosopumilus sp.]|nr:LLM class flavin-dependent oxidoreductase [Nitrosopumilus sp.]
LKIGISVSNYGDFPSREFLQNAAKESEKQELDSIWTSDHIIVPKNHTPWTRVFETIITLAFISSITEQITLGTSIILLPLRNPIVLAKQIATLDALSKGGVIIGIGIGWNDKEFDIVGKDFASRTKTVKNQVEQMRKLWSGGFVNEGFVSEPLPDKKNGPPILIGGQSQGALKRVASFGDGWHPVGITPTEYEQGKQKITQIQNQDYLWSLRLGFAANKTINSEYVGTDGKKRIRLVGDVNQIINEIEKYQKIGLEHLILDVRDVSSEEYLEQIKIIGQIRRSFSKN